MLSREEVVTWRAWIVWSLFFFSEYRCFCIGGRETSFLPTMVLLARAVEVAIYAALLRKIGLEQCDIRGMIFLMFLCCKLSDSSSVASPPSCACRLGSQMDEVAFLLSGCIYSSLVRFALFTLL